MKKKFQNLKPIHRPQIKENVYYGFKNTETFPYHCLIDAPYLPFTKENQLNNLYLQQCQAL
jgi:hypothetical protein